MSVEISRESTRESSFTMRRRRRRRQHHFVCLYKATAHPALREFGFGVWRAFCVFSYNEHSRMLLCDLDLESAPMLVVWGSTRMYDTHTHAHITRHVAYTAAQKKTPAFVPLFAPKFIFPAFPPWSWPWPCAGLCGVRAHKTRNARAIVAI